MRSNPERLAWAILLTAFFICIGLAVAIPLGIRSYILYSTVAQRVTLEVQRPPLSVTLAGRGLPVSVAERLDEVAEQTIVDTDNTAGRLVMRSPRGTAAVIATVQLYDDTTLALTRVRTPRFSISDLPHQVALALRAGRVRVNVYDDAERATVVTVQTPYGPASLTDGSYDLRVNGAEAEITVRDGTARIGGDEVQMELHGGERALITANYLLGPLPAPPNLIVNGDFRLPLSDGWESYHEEIEEPPGNVEVVTDEGREVAVFSRTGRNHAEVGLRQEINYDVQHFTALELRLDVRVGEHNVPVCGTKGSECPVMVRLVYLDADGVEREWLQGFYWLPDSSTPGNPLVCVTCSTRNEHIRVPKDAWYPYVSPNLVPLLSQDGRAPSVIESIAIYASGHTYRSAVAEVELIGQE